LHNNLLIMFWVLRKALKDIRGVMTHLEDQERKLEDLMGEFERYIYTCKLDKDEEEKKNFEDKLEVLFNRQTERLDDMAGRNKTDKKNIYPINKTLPALKEIIEKPIINKSEQEKR